MTDRAGLIRNALEKAPTALGYVLNEAICALFSDRYVMRTVDRAFDLDTFVARCHPSVIVRDAPLPEWDSVWDGPGRGVNRRLAQGHRSVAHEGVMYDVIEVAWVRGFETVTTQWWIGPSREQVERFAAHVAEIANEIDDEVLVYAAGCWHRSPKLRDAIRDTTFESLILADGLARQIEGDFRRFLSARDEYRRFGVPWKRGVLLLGPPGNGKTHCVKALLNALSLPCLYVQSFVAREGDGGQREVSEVFARARRTTPCAIVLEDIDSLIGPGTRSFFLNELDGFADNTGIITIATTNHPERLDPAILERPSRFDRKYHFGLPAMRQRSAYLAQWNARLELGARLTVAHLEGLADATEGFSYAYLKELVLSSLVAWMSGDRKADLHSVAAEQVAALREQMQTTEEQRDPALVATAAAGRFRWDHRLPR